MHGFPFDISKDYFVKETQTIKPKLLPPFYQRDTLLYTNSFVLIMMFAYDSILHSKWHVKYFSLRNRCQKGVEHLYMLWDVPRQLLHK